MSWLSKWLIAAVLATSFGTAVHGQNACLTDELCAVSSSGQLRLESCNIADTDLDDLATCLTTAGRTSIKTLSLQENLLTTIPSDLLEGTSALVFLELSKNAITTIDEDAFQPMASILTYLSITDNQLTTLPSGIFAGMEVLEELYLFSNLFTTVPLGIFDDLGAVSILNLGNNMLTTIPSDLFEGMSALSSLTLSQNAITTIDQDAFQPMASILIYLQLQDNQLTTLPLGVFAGMGVLEYVYLQTNQLTTLPLGIFDGLGAVSILAVSDNALTTLPAGIFENLPSDKIVLFGNPDLQCLPSFSESGSSTLVGQEIAVTGCCECTDVATCDAGLFCNPGVDGYTCDATEKSVCGDGNECDAAAGEECCATCQICEASANIDVGACGDPHMTGFRGQKFDFAGKDGAWYAVVSDLPYMHLNMRVTSPVPSVPEITYITGISIVTTDNRGRDHTIVISVKNPHSMESSCAAGVPSCLADGALQVVVDGEEVMINPSEVYIAPGVAIGAVNLPGACRSFGFEKYWERKVELLPQTVRRLSLMNDMQDMSDWVLADPTATNMVECAEYVAHATAVDGVGLFAHQSEHASFQVVTPTATIRLSHGRLHQLPMRDPTDQFDLPDHLTWQMNLAVDHSDMSLDARGILGETLVPTLDEHGAPIMQGMGAIRGAQEDYRVSGPLGIVFAQGQHHT